MSSYRVAKLSEIAEVGAGNSAPQKKELFHEGTYPFVRTSDVGQIRFGTISSAADLLNDKGIKGLRLVPKGTILMPKSGASTFLNHRVETSIDCYVSSHLATVTAKPDKAIPRYLLYFLSTVQAQDLIQDHKYPSLTLGVIGSIEVSLPPLEEQRRIVAVLDQAFAALDRARALAEANLADADAFLSGVLADALQGNSQRWESYPLESLCIKGRKIGYGVLKPGRHDQQGVRLIKSQQVRDDAMDLTEDFRITKELDKQYARTRLQGGEILLNLVGASIGRSAIAPAELSGANISRAVAVLPVEPELARWVQLNLRGPTGQKLIEEKTGGSAQPVLNLSEVKSLPIPLPSERERADLLRKVEGLSKMGTSLAQGYRTKIRGVSDLRRSLLQKAFSGELT